MNLRLLWFFFSNMRQEQGSTIANSPAGYRGFYTFGISSYIKRHYDLANYRFSGASAGAGNSLYLTFKGDDETYVNGMLDRVDAVDTKSIRRILREICEYNIDRYTTDDFDLDRLEIGVTCVNGLRKECTTYSQFDSLEDAVECTAVSCNIPFVSGSLMSMYRRRLSYDGVFCRYPNVYEDDFLVEPWMWREAKQYRLFGFVRVPQSVCRLYEGLFGSRRHKARELYEMGWNDAEAHRAELDAYFGVE